MGMPSFVYGVTHSNPVGVTPEVHSRFRVGLRSVYLERHRSWLVIIFALPGMLIARGVSPSLTEIFDRARATLLPTTKPQKSCRGLLMDP